MEAMTTPNLEAIKRDSRGLVYISDGTPGSDRVLRLLTAIPTLIDTLEAARQHRGGANHREVITRLHATNAEMEQNTLGQRLTVLDEAAEALDALAESEFWARHYLDEAIEERDHARAERDGYQADAEAWRRYMAIQAATDNATQVKPPTVPHRGPSRR